MWSGVNNLFERFVTVRGRFRRDKSGSQCLEEERNENERRDPEWTVGEAFESWSIDIDRDCTE